MTPPTTIDENAGEESPASAAESTEPQAPSEWRRTLVAVADAAPGGFADGCIVYALDPDDVWQYALAGCERPAAELPAGLPACVLEVVAAARPRLAGRDDAAPDDDSLARPEALLRRLGADSLMLVPGRVDGRVVAVLAFLRRAPRAAFQPGDLAFAEALTTVAAHACENARCHARERRAHDALELSEARFRALVSASSHVVWTTDANGTVRDDSPTWREFTGQSREQWQERGWLESVHPDDHARARSAWMSALQQRRVMELECRVRRPDGSYCWTVTRATPVLDAGGRLREWVAKNIDISERKRFEAALQESETRLRLAVEAADIGTWDYDPRTGVLVWSEREKALFGLPSDASVDHDTFLRGIHVDDRERTVEKVDYAQDPASGGHYRDEFRTIGLEDGVERWISARGRCFFDDQGVPARFLGVDIDVTEKHLSSQRMALLAEASRALVPGRERSSVEGALAVVARGVARRLGDVCWIALLADDGRSLESIAVEARTTRLVARMAPLHGARVSVEGDWLGRTVLERRSRLVPVLDANTAAELLRVEGLRPVLAGADFTSLVLVPLVVADRALGVIAGFREGGRAYGRADLLMLQDLADRCALAVAETRSFHRAERALQQIESIIDAVPYPISYIDASGRYAYVSRGYALWFGPPRTRFVGEHVRENVGPAAWERIRPFVEGALRGERQQYEEVVPFARGGTRTISATYIPQFDETGRPAGFVAVILDVSEHRAMVESLRRSLRFSEEFVGMLGHDLRSPLNAIALTCVTLLNLLDGGIADQRATRSVLRIQNSARRMSRMIEQILDFTRARLGGGIPIRPATVDLAALVDAILVEVQSSSSQTIELELTGDTRGQWDPDRIEQVLSNLLANAVEHGSGDAPVRLSVRGTEPDLVEFSVWNEGAIPESVQPIVFDRYQHGTAGPAGRPRGLGLGLYIVRQIVLAHGGTIELRSSEVDGTCFTVRLPRVAVPLPATEPA